MTNASEPTLNWSDAPGHFREAHDRLRAELEETKKAAPALEAAQREIAMLRAGVDTSHPGYEMFSANYSGKNEPGAIQEAWTSIFGAATPPAPPAPEAQPPAETAPPANPDGSDPALVAQLTDLQNQRGVLGTGATAPGEEPSIDPQVDMLKTFHAARKSGSNMEQAQAAGFAKVFTAAAEGDARVVSQDAVEARQKWLQRNGY